MPLSSSRLMLLLLLAFVAQLPARAQQKLLTMDDAFLNRSLQPQALRQLTWIPGSKDEFSFVQTTAGADELLRGSAGAGAGKVSVAMPLAKFSTALQGVGADEFKTFPQVQWLDQGVLLATNKSHVYRYDVKSGQAVKAFGYADAVDNVEADPTQTRVAYTKAQNLYVSAAGRENEAVTQETNPQIVNGQAAHRSEFGITKGTFWSPRGNKLAYYRMDQTMVTDYPIVDVSVTPAREKAIKYPMAGDKSHQVTVGVYDLASRKTVFLQTGEPREQYLTNLAWSPDERFIYLAGLNRGQSEMKLNQYDAGTGAFIKTLFEEKDAKYVEPQHPVQFVPGHPDQFVWRSQRDGFEHLYCASLRKAAGW
jgi:dipeptidyl-peptidase-4